MALSLEQKHRRFRQQLGWTRSLRKKLLSSLIDPREDRVLEVGCGTGALLGELDSLLKIRPVGLDLDLSSLAFARELSQAGLTGGDAHRLPFADDTFDLTVCHFLLLWLDHPAGALKEMQRVTRPGRFIAAFAEPDYGGRIDHPPPLDMIKPLQIRSLIDQGAQPRIGRRLRELFLSTGMEEVTTGVFQGQWTDPPSQSPLQGEWDVLREDLKPYLSEEELDSLREVEVRSWTQGIRTLFIPTFYAWGRV